MGGWWLVCMPCPSPPPYAPRPSVPARGGVIWLVGVDLGCAVCCVSFFCCAFHCAQNPPIGRACVVDVKYPCSCVASSPFPSHHLGSALGGVVVLFPAPLGHRRSETSSGLEFPFLLWGSPLGGGEGRPPKLPRRGPAIRQCSPLGPQAVSPRPPKPPPGVADRPRGGGRGGGGGGTPNPPPLALQCGGLFNWAYGLVSLGPRNRTRPCRRWSPTNLEV